MCTVNVRYWTVQMGTEKVTIDIDKVHDKVAEWWGKVGVTLKKITGSSGTKPVAKGGATVQPISDPGNELIKIENLTFDVSTTGNDVSQAEVRQATTVLYNMLGSKLDQPIGNNIGTADIHVIFLNAVDIWGYANPKFSWNKPSPRLALISVKKSGFKKEGSGVVLSRETRNNLETGLEPANYNGTSWGVLLDTGHEMGHLLGFGHTPRAREFQKCLMYPVTYVQGVKMIDYDFPAKYKKTENKGIRGSEINHTYLGFKGISPEDMIKVNKNDQSTLSSLKKQMPDSEYELLSKSDTNYKNLAHSIHNSRSTFPNEKETVKDTVQFALNKIRGK